MIILILIKNNKFQKKRMIKIINKNDIIKTITVNNNLKLDFKLKINKFKLKINKI